MKVNQTERPNWGLCVHMYARACVHARKNRHQTKINNFIIYTRHISNIMDIRTYRGANINSDHYLVGAKLRARISNAKNSIVAFKQSLIQKHF